MQTLTRTPCTALVDSKDSVGASQECVGSSEPGLSSVASAQWRMEQPVAKIEGQRAGVHPVPDNCEANASLCRPKIECCEIILPDLIRRKVLDTHPCLYIPLWAQ